VADLGDEMRMRVWEALASEDPETLFKRFEEILVDVRCSAIDQVSFKLGLLLGSSTFKGDISPRLTGMIGATLEEIKDGFKGEE